MTDLRHHPRCSPTRRELLRCGGAAATFLCIPTVACAQTEPLLDRFADLAGHAVPAGARTVLTRGWRESGIGGARYVFDPRVDRDWVRRNPRSSAITADGRGFRLDTHGGDVRRYGALGDGTTDDADAINEALRHGGTVVLTGPATYLVQDRLLLTISQTRLAFDAAVRLRTQAWRYRGTQQPFGNAIHVTADDCTIVGSGATSVLETFDSDANGIGFFHCSGGRVSGLKLIGGKNRLRAIIDDTFQSGISIVNDRANNPDARPSRVVIEDCAIFDWMQYGINIYGNLASNIIVRRTKIARSGQSGDPQSVGAGIALTRGVGPVLVASTNISDCTGFGILISSAGAQIQDIILSGNRITGNGADGIRCSEEHHYSGVAAIGQQHVTIRDNIIERNAGMGIRAGTYDGIGSIRDLRIERNRIASNFGSGILLQANPMPGRGVEAVVNGNELVSNGDYGLAIGENRIQLRHDANRYEGNRRGRTVDYRNGAPRSLPGL